MSILKKIGIVFLVTNIIIFTIFVYMFFYSFKTDYIEVVKIASKQNNIDKSLIFAVIKAESKFNTMAESSKGAIGLMQILPSTANFVLQNNLKDYTKCCVEKNDLFNPEINIILGTKYLKYLIDKFKNVDVAICAYNAGETNVRAWLNDKKYSNDGKTINSIPFLETKNYLKKVNFNQKIYKKMLKN